MGVTPVQGEPATDVYARGPEGARFFAVLQKIEDGRPNPWTRIKVDGKGVFPVGVEDPRVLAVRNGPGSYSIAWYGPDKKAKLAQTAPFHVMPQGANGQHAAPPPAPPPQPVEPRTQTPPAAPTVADAAALHAAAVAQAALRGTGPAADFALVYALVQQSFAMNYQLLVKGQEMAIEQIRASSREAIESLKAAHAELRAAHASPPAPSVSPELAAALAAVGAKLEEVGNRLEDLEDDDDDDDDGDALKQALIALSENPTDLERGLVAAQNVIGMILNSPVGQKFGDVLAQGLAKRLPSGAPTPPAQVPTP